MTDTPPPAVPSERLEETASAIIQRMRRMTPPSFLGNRSLEQELVRGELERLLQQLREAQLQRDEAVRFLGGRVKEEFDRAESLQTQLGEAHTQIAQLQQRLNERWEQAEADQASLRKQLEQAEAALATEREAHQALQDWVKALKEPV